MGTFVAYHFELNLASMINFSHHQGVPHAIIKTH